ncbi:hypothetical protein R3P38DRAFT_3204718 [Favolaschia claudopus]|uniref:Uncharacterized protein n=1 Tax=Favolaschia claudopus TaxID=2862362 RepID=A0AAW0AQ23_9AGAR
MPSPSVFSLGCLRVHPVAPRPGVQPARFPGVFSSPTPNYGCLSINKPSVNEALEEHPESSILAFVAIKIFSVLANSMAEERTVSRFTRTDSRDRASQDARTIVDQTKIHQYLRPQFRAEEPKPKASNAPSVKWRSVRTLFSEIKPPTMLDAADGNSSTNTPHLFITPACEAGLEALNNSTDDDYAPATSSSSVFGTTLDTHRDGVDTRLAYFRDLLSDQPVNGADAIRSISDWSKDTVYKRLALEPKIKNRF